VSRLYTQGVFMLKESIDLSHIAAFIAFVLVGDWLFQKIPWVININNGGPKHVTARKLLLASTYGGYMLMSLSMGSQVPLHVTRHLYYKDSRWIMPLVMLMYARLKRSFEDHAPMTIGPLCLSNVIITLPVIFVYMWMHVYVSVVKPFAPEVNDTISTPRQAMTEVFFWTLCLILCGILGNQIALVKQLSPKLKTV